MPPIFRTMHAAMGKSLSPAFCTKTVGAPSDLEPGNQGQPWHGGWGELLEMWGRTGRSLLPQAAAYSWQLFEETGGRSLGGDWELRSSWGLWPYKAFGEFLNAHLQG